MNTVIIGSGNVANVLGRKIVAAGHTVWQVVGRNTTLVRELAAALHAAPILDFSLVSKEADLYIISISDTALYEVPALLALQRGIVVHTAGSVPMEVLAPIGRPHGILYPLQSLRKEMKELPAIPILVDAVNEATLQTLLEFARSLSSQVVHANNEMRMQLHVAAVFVSNFTNYLYALAHDYSTQQNIPFSLLQPLMEETATRLREYTPAEVQTGPAARKDRVTMEKHLALLKNNQPMANVYSFMSESILAYNS